MATLHLRIETPCVHAKGSVWQPSTADAALLDHAASILHAGGTVAIPTETVYGLAANAFDPDAVAKIFLAKQRPHWDPLIVHVSDLIMAQSVVADISPAAQILIDAFWPGPLTLLLPRSKRIPDIVTAARPLVGVRMPIHPVAVELIRRAGVPLAAPSANRFGHISPTTAEHVLEDLDNRIDAVIDAGPTAFGVESTVLDPGQHPAILYRPGAISRERIDSALEPHYGQSSVLEWKTSALSDQPREALPSPGVGLRHYAPRARLILVPAHATAIVAALSNLTSSVQRVGLLLPQHLPGEMLPALHREAICFPWGNWLLPETLAESLYAGLRSLDSAGCSAIVVPTPQPLGIGAALLDRLQKAAVPSRATNPD
jgi:L-threonylcarbamoyladenylate synthase